MNILSTIYLLDYIKDINSKPKLIFTLSCGNYTSSIKFYGVKIPTSKEVLLSIEDIYYIHWTYASNKILGRLRVYNMLKKFGYNTIIVRYHYSYGLRIGLQHVIPVFTLRLKSNNTKIEKYGGYQYRSFCFVEDAAKMTINVKRNNRTDDNITNIGNDQEIKINDVANQIFRLMNANPEVI